MNSLCIRCQRRERHGQLLICAACSETLIRSEQSQEPVLRVPEWRRRSLARDWTGRLAA